MQGVGVCPLCVQGWPEGCGSREEGRQDRRVLPPGKQGMESTPSDHRSCGPAAPPAPQRTNPVSHRCPSLSHRPNNNGANVCGAAIMPNTGPSTQETS